MLLTGGASRRMGRDKATLVINGTRLAQRTGDLLQLVAGPVIEVGPGYTSLPHSSEDPPGSGPLAAIAAGAAELARLHYSGSVLVVATDLPRLTEAYLTILASHPVPSPDHSVVPRDEGGTPQPLCARYSAAALAVARTLVGDGQRSMKALLEAVPITWLDMPQLDTHVLNDIDTPEDLAAVLHAPRPSRASDPIPDEAIRP
jgi:molybdopterin-guanine dinucleotide biosynthesis protein A